MAGAIVAMAYGVGSLTVAVVEGSTSRWWVLLLSRGAAAAVVGAFAFFWSYFAFFRPAASLPPGQIRPSPSPGLGPPDIVASVAGVVLGLAGVVGGLLAGFQPIVLLGLMFVVLGLGTMLLAWRRSRRSPDTPGRKEQTHDVDPRPGIDV